MFQLLQPNHMIVARIVTTIKVFMRPLMKQERLDRPFLFHLCKKCIEIVKGTLLSFFHRCELLVMSFCCHLSTPQVLNMLFSQGV